MAQGRGVRSKPAAARARHRLGGADIPLYLRIEAELKTRIAAGRHPSGSALPTEAELCTEFGASRHTIREALRRLQADGVVSRRPRVGTVVLVPEPPARYVQSFNVIEDLFQVAIKTHYVLRSVTPVTLDRDLAALVGGAAGEAWLRVRGVRWDRPGGSAICYIESFVPNRYAAIVEEFPGLRGPFYALLERRSGETIDEVQQEITAAPMPDRAIEMLGLEQGAPSMLLLRRYRTRRGTLIASFNWHRADQFVYRMHLHRHPGSQP